MPGIPQVMLSRRRRKKKKDNLTFFLFSVFKFKSCFRHRAQHNLRPNILNPQLLFHNVKTSTFVYVLLNYFNLYVLLNYFTQGADLLRRGATRHDASSFTILETLMNHKANIRALFQSNGWILSQTTAKPEEGREVECCVLEDGYLEFTRWRWNPWRGRRGEVLLGIS